MHILTATGAVEVAGLPIRCGRITIRPLGGRPRGTAAERVRGMHAPDQNGAPGRQDVHPAHAVAEPVPRMHQTGEGASAHAPRSIPTRGRISVVTPEQQRLPAAPSTPGDSVQILARRLPSSGLRLVGAGLLLIAAAVLGACAWTTAAPCFCIRG